MPVIGLFEDAALRVLLSVADLRRLHANEVLFRQGERSDGAFALLNGSLAVGREGEADHEAVVLGPGSLLGQTALFIRMQRPSTAIALEASEVMRISPTLMRRVLQQYPDAAERMYGALAGDLDALSVGLDTIRETFEAMNRT